MRDDFDDDEDTAKGMARLFAEVAEAYILLVASAVPEVRLVEVWGLMWGWG